VETREYVEYLLKNYHQLRGNIEQLRFELEHLNKIEPVEVIESMNFAAPSSEKVTSNSISDKTSQIALVYRESAERMNNTSVREIGKMILANEYELRRLDYCVERLETKIKTVVKAIYIEQVRWSEICSRLFVTEKTVNKYRKKGIDEVVRMFEVIFLVNRRNLPI
jgi:DNA-directed RNA polymerase specialized sigma24 family protein